MQGVRGVAGVFAGNKAPCKWLIIKPRILSPTMILIAELPMPSPLFVAKNQHAELCLLPALANRHGLITGATGTGKTVTLQRLAEAFSDAGVAVFAADIKGDLCGLGAAGAPSGKLAERIAAMPWLNHRPQAYPVVLWDVAGRSGHPLRTTLSEMGPLLLGALLELTDSQQAALYAAFRVADREGLLLLDLKDLKALLNHLQAHPEVLGEERRRALEAGNRARMERNGSETLTHDLAACNAWQDGLAAATRRDCPTLLLCGALDRMTPVKAIGPLHEALRAGGGEVRLVELAGCGHAMQEEDPAAVVRAMLWSD